MRSLLYPFLAALVAASSLAVTGKARDCAAPSWRSLEPGTLVDVDSRLSGDTLGYVVGNFAGTGVDTLYCIALGCRSYMHPDDLSDDDVYDNIMDTYRLASQNPALADFYVTDHPDLNFLKAGDLDNDGRDELQFLQNWPTSSILGYGAYDYFNGEWVMLTSPVTFCSWNRDCDESTVVFESCSTPGSVAVYEDEFLPADDPVEWVTVRKIIPIERQPIPYRYSVCSALPGGSPILLPVTVVE